LNSRIGKHISVLVVIAFSAAIISACSSPNQQEFSISANETIESFDQMPEPEQVLEESAPLAKGVYTPENNPPVSPAQAIAAPSSKESPQFGIGGGYEPENSAPVIGSEPPATPDPALAVAPQIGAVAPNFTLQTINGEEVKLDDLRGEAVMVNYWVTWCIPCLEEMPILEKLHREYQEQGFTLLSVNGIAQDDMNTVMSTLDEFNVTFPVALDEGDAVYNEFQVRFMPTTFFIDKQGVIQHIQLGSTSEEGFRTQIEELLSGEL
jgi:peroxiredoxin